MVYSPSSAVTKAEAEAEDEDETGRLRFGWNACHYYHQHHHHHQPYHDHHHHRQDQHKLFPKGVYFEDEAEQREYVLDWIANKAGMPLAARKIRIEFYYGRYHRDYGSIFSMGSIMNQVPEEQNDICILEEPEHLVS